MAEDFIDVQELIQRTSLQELNENAELYFQRFAGQARLNLLSKPYTIRDAAHFLPTFGHLAHGLDLRPGQRVLDFGCGAGWGSRILAQMGLEVISLDVSPTALALGQELLRLCPLIGNALKPQFLLYDGLSIDLPDQSLDRIFCNDSLHHVPDQKRTLSEFYRVLKPGGIAGFCEPGAEHSKSPAAQQEMKFGVIENDVDLRLIKPLALKIGFCQVKAMLWMLPSGLMDPEEIANLRKSRAAKDKLVDEMLWFTSNNQIFYLYKPDEAGGASRKRLRSASLVPEQSSYQLQKGESLSVSLKITNTSDYTWKASGEEEGCVNLGALLSSGQGPAREFRRKVSPVPTGPGQSVTQVFELEPLEPGEYELHFDLVEELVCWFKEYGVEPAVVKISVRA